MTWQQNLLKQQKHPSAQVHLKSTGHKTSQNELKKLLDVKCNYWNDNTACALKKNPVKLTVFTVKLKVQFLKKRYNLSNRNNSCQVRSFYWNLKFWNWKSCLIKSVSFEMTIPLVYWKRIPVNLTALNGT